MNYKFQSILIAIAILLTMSACKKQDYSEPSTSGTDENDVLIQNMAFSPAIITVAVNTTVKWSNKDNSSHNVTSNDGIFQSGNMKNGDSYSYKFGVTGTYVYHCSIHSSMSATIIVKP